MHKLQFSVQSLPKSPRIAIIVGVFHENITNNMLEACKNTLKEYSVTDVKVFEVPGSFEIPLTAKKIAKSGKFDCIIALGAVIKGETHHFELVSNECARGIMNVMLETEVPIIFEILATKTLQQAKKRSSGKNNKGEEAALSALKLLSTFSNNFS